MLSRKKHVRLEAIKGNVGHREHFCGRQEGLLNRQCLNGLLVAL